MIPIHTSNTPVSVCTSMITYTQLYPCNHSVPSSGLRYRCVSFAFCIFSLITFSVHIAQFSSVSNNLKCEENIFCSKFILENIETYFQSRNTWTSILTIIDSYLRNNYHKCRSFLRQENSIFIFWQFE